MFQVLFKWFCVKRVLAGLTCRSDHVFSTCSPLQKWSMPQHLELHSVTSSSHPASLHSACLLLWVQKTAASLSTSNSWHWSVFQCQKRSALAGHIIYSGNSEKKKKLIKVSLQTVSYRDDKLVNSTFSVQITSAMVSWSLSAGGAIGLV